MLTIREGAKRQGVATVTLRNWLAQRRLEYVRLSARAIRIPLAEIERLIEAGTVPARRR